MAFAFTHAQNHKNVSTTETYIFWIGLFICPLLWVVFLVTSFLKINFTWMVGGRTGREGATVEGRGWWVLVPLVEGVEGE